MLRKFLAETVTNGSIGLNRPKGYIPLGQRQKKPLLAVLAADSFVLIVCFLAECNFREMAKLAIQDPRVRLQQHHENSYAG